MITLEVSGEERSVILNYMLRNARTHGQSE
jgi:hypothetical protein